MCVCLRAMLCSLNVYFLHFALTSRSCWLFSFSFSVSLVLLLVKLIRGYLSLMKYCYYFCCWPVFSKTVYLLPTLKWKRVGLQYLENMHLHLNSLWRIKIPMLEGKLQKQPLTRLTDHRSITTAVSFMLKPQLIHSELTGLDNFIWGLDSF